VIPITPTPTPTPTPRQHRRRLALAVPLAVLALVALGSLASEPALPQAPLGTWSVLPELPQGRQEVASVQAGGQVHVAGGKPYSRTANHFRYDPAARTWAQLPPLPTPPGAAGLDHVAAAAIGDRIFYVGGMRNGAYPGPVTGQVAVFDVREGRFLPDAAAPMTRPRAAGALVAHEGRLLYVGGLADEVVDGQARRVAVPWLDEYDPRTRTWTALADMPTKRDHLGAVVAAGKLWAVGGRNVDIGAATGATEAYDLATRTWSPAGAHPPMAARRGGFAIGVVGDDVVAIGGEGREPSGPTTALSSVEAFDARAGGPWRPMAPMPLGGRHGMQAAQCGGTLVVAGGAGRVGFDGSPGAGLRNEAFAPGGVVVEGCGAAPAPPPTGPGGAPEEAPAPSPPPAGGSTGASASPRPAPAPPATPRACDRGRRDSSRSLLRARMAPRAVTRRTPARLRLALRARAELCVTLERRGARGGWRALRGRVVRRAGPGTTTLAVRRTFAGRRLRAGSHRLTVVAQAMDGRRTTLRLRFSVVR
jgi:hypothetical protein